jgi:hypothetical protein
MNLINLDEITFAGGIELGESPSIEDIANAIKNLNQINRSDTISKYERDYVKFTIALSDNGLGCLNHVTNSRTYILMGNGFIKNIRSKKPFWLLFNEYRTYWPATIPLCKYPNGIIVDIEDGGEKDFIYDVYCVSDKLSEILTSSRIINNAGFEFK